MKSGEEGEEAEDDEVVEEVSAWRCVVSVRIFSDGRFPLAGDNG